MTDTLLWILTIVSIGAIGSTAKYAHGILRGAEAFSWRRWIMTTFVGTTVAVISGLVCRDFMLSQEITYAIVAISAISSKELIEYGPDIIMKLILRIKK